MVHLNWILAWFEALSRLRRNLEKSVVLLVERVENLDWLALELGCNVAFLPTTYLGVPLGAKHDFVTAWAGWRKDFPKGC